MDRFVVPTDGRVFLGRLTQLDPRALVRLRAGTATGPPGQRTALWARLPWAVLVTREVAGGAPGDVTVGAEALLAADGSLPPRRDREWRWPLPPGTGEVVEELPVGELRAIARAAAGTLQEVTERGLHGRPVGSRMVREALLEHVAVVVDAGDDRVEVPQRLVQAVLRMGFLGPEPAGADSVDPGADGVGPDPGAAPEPAVRVRRAGRWIGLAARYGTGWLPPPALPVRQL